MTDFTTSIIIPVLNEAKNIEDTLVLIKDQVASSDLEIIVVDGGSTDNTVSIAQELDVMVIASPLQGRANQMNVGAAVATGNILLFLHADTKLPHNYDQLIQNTLSKPNVIAGAFELAIDSQRKSLRLVEALVKMRSHLLALPYGDQALFMKRSTFNNVGGFPDLVIMEDFALVKQLKRHGKIAIAPAAVTTSSRRWDKLGVWRTTLINQLMIIGYYLGISPNKLRELYLKGKK
ncbi:MAG: TIGR04283 family arsenosugar biosynthesis glycosyltransferase [Xenococcus sp. MO_188.B8]|nr:TIGR04283 family arsenosugar biosynthesis glycosyltransferase [Xenococcus sp. MO_188.B8]